MFSASLFSTAVTKVYFVKAPVMKSICLCCFLAANIGPNRSAWILMLGWSGTGRGCRRNIFLADTLNRFLCVLKCLSKFLASNMMMWALCIFLVLNCVLNIVGHVLHIMPFFCIFQVGTMSFEGICSHQSLFTWFCCCLYKVLMLSFAKSLPQIWANWQAICLYAGKCSWVVVVDIVFEDLEGQSEMDQKLQ